MRVFRRAASAALAVTILAAGSAAAQSGQKLAYIRSSVLLDQAPGRGEGAGRVAERQADAPRAIVDAEDPHDRSIRCAPGTAC